MGTLLARKDFHCIHVNQKGRTRVENPINSCAKLKNKPCLSNYLRE